MMQLHRLSEFPYRVIDSPLATQLHERTESIEARLSDVIRASITIGQAIAWAQENLRPEVFTAWLHCELGWKPCVADAYIDAALNFGGNGTSFYPAAALEMANVLSARSVCALELVKARRLIAAYREIIKGDVFTGWPRSGRPRTTMKGPRVRGRVFRTAVRRYSARPESTDSE